ncbi:5'-3' exoribonuclease 3-like [Cynara cardunculus var. scolymus]|uniref:5'-3' exoribonuclease 3-like n=1 Tax=Cynara cardunculus var. scolymus TaxID=59895 RepID=UPI000D627CD9|nr:5'-3' exoribonuclease 3-like [Cynara cardunculus var. scolymus]
MGVPRFYRWLLEKYPKIVVNVEEEDDVPNTNGREFDNLYLDMNEIIHPCFHPEDNDILLKEASPLYPETYDKVFESIFECIDRILLIVRPRKLLFMSIDGVAPRAKMNQQRTRRFRNAKDREILGKEEARLRRQYDLQGRDLLSMEESEVSDSNVIAPGTEFMSELSEQLQTYIRMRISNHPTWKQLKVILSDANVPGEGEHKIMSFIRHQRTCPGYNPDTSHVLYGLDTDLIMLALASHEVHFSILRHQDENVLVKDLNHQGLKDTVEQMSNLEEIHKRKSLVKKPYQFLHVWILREYLNLDFKMMNMPENFESDSERLIDDFIFICFFAGNDFLPQMPTLNIYEGAIDLLIQVYKEEFQNLGGYLIDVQRVNDRNGGYINLKRVEKFILAVGTYEDEIFKKRSRIHERKLRRMISEDARGNGEENYLAVGSDGNSSCIVRPPDHNVIVENTKMLKRELKSYARERSYLYRNGRVTDLVKLGDHGWKNRYYRYKFFADTEQDMENMRKILVEKYAEGLCWVLLYYFSDAPSWTWFFPYHYGPFASDLEGLSNTKPVLRKGLPLKPFDQLMAILPPMSANALPLSYQSLMTDEDSSILDFYPTEFEIDTDGKTYFWEGVCKLPFIEEEPLLAATKKIEKELSEEEAKRNAENFDLLFIHCSEHLAQQIINAKGSVEQNISIKIDTGLCGDINGFVHLEQESENVSDSNGLANDLDVLCVDYHPPNTSCLYIPRMLEGVTIPETFVSESDIEERPLWHAFKPHHGSWQVTRSYNHVQEVKRNHSVGFRSLSCPGVMVKGCGSGWSQRGRGYNATGTTVLNEQTSVPSFWDTNGRGSCGNSNGQQTSSDSGLGQSRRVFTQSTTYPAIMANNPNDQFWSVRTDSGSGSKQALQRWGGTQSRNSDRW